MSCLRACAFGPKNESCWSCCSRARRSDWCRWEWALRWHGLPPHREPKRKGQVQVGASTHHHHRRRRRHPPRDWPWALPSCRHYRGPPSCRLGPPWGHACCRPRLHHHQRRPPRMLLWAPWWACRRPPRLRRWSGGCSWLGWEWRRVQQREQGWGRRPCWLGKACCRVRPRGATPVR